MLDYAKNIKIAKAGDIKIDEVPKSHTEGLTFNGSQFLRIGDTPDLSFENIQLRYVRALTFWVYFEEFTNNAKVFDFGNGAGKDNVFVGIIGRGNEGVQQEEIVPSGQQCTREVSPRIITDIDIWDCPDPEIFGKIVEPLQPFQSSSKSEPKTADLLYEIWDSKQRKLHIQVKNVIPLKKWVHIAITTTNNDPWKPDLKIYANGEVVHSEESAWLPQTNTKNNYIGKSNWMNVTSPYDNADELFKGRLFDFRGYRTAMTKNKIKDTYDWGKKLLL